MSVMSESCPKPFETFMKLSGSVDSRIREAKIDLPDQEALMEKMKMRNRNLAVDALVPSSCNQSCIACFFEPYGGPGILAVTPDVVKDINTLLEQFPKENIRRIFYPREPLSAMQLLPVYTSVGETKLLTNAKLLGNDGVIQSLKNAGITNITVTVPGLADSYAQYTNEPANSYDRLLENISLAIRSDLKVDVFTPVFRKNIEDVSAMTRMLADMNVREIKFIRVIPTGRARDLPDDFFLDKDTTVRFLINVNKARLENKDLRLSLFGGSFGPNFYDTSMYRYLAGLKNVWPGSQYLCPMINRQYIGIVLGKNSLVSCFHGMSFEEQTVGFYRNGELEFTKPALSSAELSEKLRGICAKDTCQWQPLCLGGCVMARFSEAVRKKEQDPLFAGQSVCQSNIFDEYQAEQKK